MRIPGKLPSGLDQRLEKPLLFEGVFRAPTLPRQAPTRPGLRQLICRLPAIDPGARRREEIAASGRKPSF